ncbi:adenylate/guanylate cyclase domain-containing protein [Argonema antarcticum]|uniref:adenylate/guanylate cyclase domain-containing protein n=1 Tax=Argonema antarcticum TaxID=2942763 RepID=UPI002012D7E6|nr:adenylate/guanylate cyclase domain-containing protein [Argonema antarcticum]MCL1475799.1 adenylate/guanylate cyclase domain-containing protein [Argonema antarcticum A004/B2]
MSTWLAAVLNSFKARLSQHIIFWVFLSLVLIEVIILIPSYYMREHELLWQIEDVSAAIVPSIARLTQQEVKRDKLLEKINNLTRYSVILGVAIYEPSGQLIGTFGESPEIKFFALKGMDMVRARNQDGSRYDIAWSARKLGINYVIIARHDAASVNRELSAYIRRIAGLVLLISAFVTSVTMLVLGSTLIVPILRLRDDLIAAGEAIAKDKANPKFYSLSVKRDDELGEVMKAFNKMYQRVRQEINERKLAEEILRVEQEKSERLLLNILPFSIAEQLKQQQSCIAERFEEVTILFADIVGFTSLAARIPPIELVSLLNEIFSAFDRLASLYSLEKIKTIGDAYMVVGGLPSPRSDHASAIAEIALDMQREITRFQRDNGEPFSIRIGIHTGPVVAGVIGLKKFSYDLWGDAVNIASRMESLGIAGSIQVTATTYELLREKYLFEERGVLKVKGRGEILAYLLKGRKS